MVKQLDVLVAEAKQDKDVLAVIVFGSHARGEKARDTDVALVLASSLSKLAASKKRLAYVSRFPKLDMHIFQQLPLYIRSRVLKEGKIKLCKDKDALFDIAYATVKEFEDFKPRYEMIIGVSHG